MTDDFYQSFENRYRGSRELIKSRLKVYIEFVEPLLKKVSNGVVVDLGCGRGEWLELLRDHGINSIGIDLDQNMLASCRKLDLKVKKIDAIKYLQQLPSESVATITSFHLVEHLEFDKLRVLVSEAFRVLIPGGLLIMETPNPENILVSTRNFYLDPTHQRPLPSELLSFVSEFSGFGRFKTVRLQESKELSQSLNPTLYEVLDGVSPDYAIVSQKQGAPNLERALDLIFSKEYGLTLNALTASYDEAINLNSRQELEQRIGELNAHVSDAEVRYADAEARVVHWHFVADNLRQELDRRINELTERLSEAEGRYTDSEARVVHWHFVADNLRQELDRRINELTERLSEAEGRYTDSEARVIHWNGVADNLRQELDRRISIFSEQLLEFLSKLKQSDIEKNKLINELENISELASRYQHLSESRSLEVERLESELRNILEVNHHHWQLSENRATEIRRLEGELESILEVNHHHWQLSENQKLEILALRGSSSWKITAPLRVVGGYARAALLAPKKIINSFTNLAITKLDSSISKLMKMALKRPRLTNFLNKLLTYFPVLKYHFYVVAKKNGLLFLKDKTSNDLLGTHSIGDSDLSLISLRTAKILNALNRALKQSEGKN
jgi:SAM-dependent methyltransferase